jgi:twinkle protein
MKTKSKFIRNLPCSQIVDCPDSGSSNVGEYEKEDGSSYYFCYKCNKPLKHDKKPVEAHQSISTAEVLSIHPKAQKDASEPVFKSQGISDRNIKQSTLEKYGVKITQNGEHYYPYGKDVFKIRGKNKNFRWSGVGDKKPLFGMDVYPSGCAKIITVVEGELDSLAASQMLSADLRFPVVSVRDGCASAVKSCKDSYEYLSSFTQIVFCFDNDDVGQKAQLECAELFPNKAKMMKMRKGYKDACDYSTDSAFKHFTEDWWASQVYMPDGIVKGKDLKSLVLEPLQKSIAIYPYGGLNDLTGGIRSSELVCITAGSGLGKSQFLREIVYKLLKATEENIGLMFLEESVKRTALSIMSLDAMKPLHLNETEATQEEKQVAFDATLGTGRLFLFDSFGSTSVDNIINRVRYMAKALDCKFIFLDHISIVVSDQQQGDERRALDEITTKLRMLCQECDITLFAVSHLRRPSGTGHEEGAVTSLSQLRGSGAIGQLSDMVFGLERHSQADDVTERHTTRVRVIKNRYSGLTGKACALYYDRSTGRMNEVFEEDLEEPK